MKIASQLFYSIAPASIALLLSVTPAQASVIADAAGDWVPANGGSVVGGTAAGWSYLRSDAAVGGTDSRPVERSSRR
jgi:hypothetical protein